MEKGKYNYDDDNPLFSFYKELKKKNKGKGINNWILLSELTEMPVQTIISIARKNKGDIMNIKLLTYVRLKNTIGIDMLSF